MQDFLLWFVTGFQHICNWNAYDHLLFVCALSVAYPISEWKRLLVLITAFTIGHSFTLALSALSLISIPTALVEFLIPVTIIVTCINTMLNRGKSKQKIYLNYFLAAFFGCIHGLGFSYLLKSLLGKEENITWPLFSFNLGLEAGQLLIISLVLLISLTLPLLFKIKKEQLSFYLSTIVCGIACLLTVEQLKNLYN